MSKYCELLARRLGADYERCELIRVSCVMHDVGKIGISDNILLKPGPLSTDEFNVMKTHPQIGRRILEGSSAEVLQLAATVAYTHHEWWDGTGYPDGLSGETIPLEGRIAAIGDVFDALTTNRVYRKAFTLGEAVEIMRNERGTHFDPHLLDLFFDSINEHVAIRENA
jgi:putative two-component system response regulator